MLNIISFSTTGTGLIAFNEDMPVILTMQYQP
jgi:hypothetical protein